MIEELDTIYGTMFIPDTDNGQYGWLKTTAASPEDEMIAMICGLLDEVPRGIALDCGANFGCWTLPLARHCLEVWAFEPQMCVYNLLEQTIRANRALVPNIRSFPIALGPAPGMILVPDVSLHDTTNFGGISLGIPHPEHPNAPMYDVEVRRIDDLGLPDHPVSFIKADVEGAELGVLRGAEKTIRRWRPIIIAECDHPRTDTQALGAFIESLGYNVEIAQDNNFIGMPI
jgi:FkbM family methyltransferase